MKIKNWFKVAGFVYLTVMFVVVGLDYGEVQPSYVIDIGTLVGGVFASIVPFLIGYFAGVVDSEES